MGYFTLTTNVWQHLNFTSLCRISLAFNSLILLQQRNTYIYVRLFTLLREVCHRHTKVLSTSASLDVEWVSQNATIRILPAAEIKGFSFTTAKSYGKKLNRMVSRQNTKTYNILTDLSVVEQSYYS